jgi:glycosyltransferase involved in cell wall biosynthesis
MKILLCHNYYQQRGGEDQSFEAESRLLESRGHDVLRFTQHNDVIDGMGRLEVAVDTLWNRRTYGEVRSLLRRQRPEVMHCTNTFPLISPAVYYAARAEGVPVVQSLRNYRLLCANGYLLRDNRVCEDCVSKALPWPAVVHRCYRQSRVASVVVASMLVLHRALRTWNRTVARYFALTEFSRQRFVDAGMPADRIAVKPNFVDPDPGPGAGGGGYAVFVGRLSPEKGIETLLSAWRLLSGRMKLKIIGDGPLAPLVREAAARAPEIEWLGYRKPEEILAVLGDATCLVMPSIWYETFGRTIIEAYAKGTPVVASRLGAMAELVDDGRTGMLFEAGSGQDLASRVAHMLDDADRLAKMRVEARRAFEKKYTGEANYRALMNIYRDAVSYGCNGQ